MTSTEFSKTAIIIGAGAHVSYGLPTAMKLTEILKSLFSEVIKINSLKLRPMYMQVGHKLEPDKVNICKYLHDQNILNSKSVEDISQQLDSFLEEFGRSQVYSIDAYLANILKKEGNDCKNNFATIGKVLISYFINSFERKTPIGLHRFDWIQYLINSFLVDPDSLEKFLKYPPRIFTFNYDNLFERSIATHLVSYHGYTEDKAKEAIEKLKITHIYGHLNTLNISDESQIISSGIKNLMVIGEERSEERMKDVSRKIRDSLLGTKSVYFLGFGFDKLNTELILPKTTIDRLQGKMPEFYSTNIGLSDSMRKKIYSNVPIDIEFFPNKDVDCMKLINEEKPIFE